MATFSVTPPLMAATPAIATALVAGLGLGAWGLAVSRPAFAPARLGAAAAVAVLGAGAYMLSLGDPARAWPAALGLVIGALLAAIRPADDAGAPAWPTAALGLAALAFLALLLGPGVPLANAGVGLLAGAATTHLALGGAVAGGATAAWGAVALASGLGTWAERAWPSSEIGWPLALLLGAWLAAAWALAGLAGTAARFAAPVLAGLGMLLVLFGCFHAPAALLIAAAAGAAGALVLPALLASRPDLVGLGRLAFLAGGGLLLVMDNRLGGVVAVGVGGLALASGAAAAPARAAFGFLAGLYAARVWIQLFLDRTSLTGYGVDLTHPYAFAALIAGALLPSAADGLARALRGHRGLTAVAGVALAAAPALVGFFIHIEAMGAWLAGLALATFAHAATAAGASDDRPGAMLLLANVATALLAAPWLIEVMNATRESRIWGVVGLGVALAAAAAWWWSARGQGDAPGAGPDAAPVEA